MDKRLIDLETKLSYQERLTEELNQVVIEQGKQIKSLQGELRSLKEQVKRGPLVKKIEDEERPPHY